MLKYGLNALKGMPKLFSYRNDVDIYTEDKTADKEFYKTLFDKLFNNSIKINDVTPLGCKTNVLNAYDNQIKTDKRRKYFIVDGDLDLILKTNRRDEKNLIILDSYCIENYIIDERAATELIYFSNGLDTREDLRSKLNFQKWLNYNAPCLIDLFIKFAILKKYDGGPKLRNANEFLTQQGKQTILDKNLIKAYSDEIRKQTIEILNSNGYAKSEEIYETDYANLAGIWKMDIDTVLKIVSAKNYLLPLLQFRINHCLNKGKALVPTKSIKLFLASNSNLERLSFLRQRIK